MSKPSKRKWIELDILTEQGIEALKQGNRPKDSDYLKFIGMRQHLSSLQAFQEWKYGKRKSHHMRTFLETVKHIILAVLILFGFWFVTLEDTTARSIMAVFSLVGWVVFVNWLGNEVMDVDKFFREIDEERAQKATGKG